MRTAVLLKIVGSVFGLIALLHLLRIFFGWNAEIGSFVIPLWLSGVALLVSAWLSYECFQKRK